MAIRLIAYDLKKPGQKHDELLQKIREYQNVQISESAYAIKTDKMVDSILAEVRPCLDRTDKLAVLTITEPFAQHNLSSLRDLFGSRASALLHHLSGKS